MQLPSKYAQLKSKIDVSECFFDKTFPKHLFDYSLLKILKTKHFKVSWIQENQLKFFFLTF